MQLLWVSPDSFTFTCVLKACSALPSLEMGRRVQCQILRRGFDSDVFVQNGLVTFYAKCGEIEEINGKLQVFQVGDKSHPRFKEIFEELESLERRLKEAGFSIDAESVLHDLDHEETEETLCNHSERIAIAYGLISTPPGTTLRIIKNLRACVNCHAAIKLISKVENREIVVRDANRFHHFKDGNCSCGDYW
ncbi:unnamed protein product [Linum tenue]|uniref:DYW domain-containing protein n=1 Tax=Linum tenue TaxID=586396 RepID=A0AAV0MSH4_9ROSI|nr:unnamed protein product [Linum tenue]